MKRRVRYSWDGELSKGNVSHTRKHAFTQTHTHNCTHRVMNVKWQLGGNKILNGIREDYREIITVKN